MLAEADDEWAKQGDTTNDAIHDIFGDDAELNQIEDLAPIGSTTRNGGTLKKDSVSFLTIQVVGEPYMDVGLNSATGPPTDHEVTELQRNDRVELDKLYGVVGSAQDSRKKMESAPALLLDKAVEEEIGNA